MPLVNKLSKIINSPPDVIQFAKDRKFEEAWIISIIEKRPNVNDIKNYLKKEPYQLLIVEFIWNSKVDEKRFVLTVFFDSTCTLKNESKYFDICLDNFYNYLDFENLVNNHDQKIIGRKHIFNTPIEAINLGIFNYWVSTSPIEIWELNSEYSKSEMIKKIKARPEIMETTLNFQGLQFRFNLSKSYNGPYYGFKTPCCNRIDAKWRINFDLVDYWIRLLLQI